MEEVVLQQALPLQNWDNLLGHEGERERLARAGPFASLLFSGPGGLGKSLFAAWYAALLNCQHPRQAGPWSCQCTNCRLVLRNTHPDVYWLKRQPGKTLIGVGEARELISQLYLKPYSAAQRVCIIDEADRLTEEAQSALLKTLEEPPAANVLILVTQQESKLLPTVLSRCRLHRFRPLDREPMLAWLEAQGCTPEAALRYACLSEGSPGRAQQLWQQPAWWEARERLLTTLLELPGCTLGRALELAARTETLKLPGLEGRNQLEWLLHNTQTVLRDLLLLQAGSPHLVHAHREAEVREASSRHNSATIQSWLQALSEAQEFSTANVNTRLLLQNLFLKLRR